MTNSQKNTIFFNRVDSKTKNLILDSIASHYGISQNAAMNEVAGVEAENLLDYMIEPQRTATYVLMQKHGLA